MASDNFQDRMMKYIKYGLSIKTTVAEGKEYNLVGINYKPSWDVIKPSENSGIYCMPANGNNGLCYYFSEVSNGVGCIFDSIEETIRYNEDMERKVDLLKEKVSELRELFVTESYEDLKELRFVTGKENRQRKAKPKKQIAKNAGVPKENEPTTDKPSQEPEPSVADDTAEEQVKNNSEEANEIDSKIAKAIGMKK